MKTKASKLIQEFSDRFLDDIKNSYKTTSNTQILTKTLPIVIRKGLDLGNEYKIYGSVGRGNWNEIPWLAILDKSICESTTQGYYIVILFDKNLRDIYISLAVGWTQFKDEYGIKNGKLKIRAICDHYAKLLNSRPLGFKDGVINLHANNSLGKGYEVGAIIAKKYSIAQLSDKVLFNDIRELITSYLELKGIVGNSILNLEVDISTYDESVKIFKKKIANESFSKNTEEAIIKLIKIANESPPEVRIRLKKEILRNRRFAEFVKKRVNYVCQICGRKPFIQSNGKPYAEADHVKPLGGKHKGLDSPDNMRCLCAQCHAILTHGSEKVIKNFLLSCNTFY